MPRFLVESYADGSVVEDQRERARRVAEHGAGIRYLRTTFLPGDETILHAFEAPSVAALREAARHAVLPYERIVDAVESSAPPFDARAPIARELHGSPTGGVSKLREPGDEGAGGEG